MWTKVSGFEDDKQVGAPAQDPERGMPCQAQPGPTCLSCLDASAQLSLSLRCRVPEGMSHPGLSPEQSPSWERGSVWQPQGS